MLVHLSNTSPYVCDLNRGPIEEANRMASAPTKKVTTLLEQKESFPKVTRTPLKLLAPEEVPMDTTATATDINASLQPVWYTEQTIVDEQSIQQEEMVSIIHEQQQHQGISSLLPRSTLPPIPSESPSLPEDDDEELLPPQPSLMHKSSTFTIEPSISLETRLEQLEKETTSDQPTPPTDDSFRALEHLLGLGSGGTVRDSPKTNHDTLSLTVVTPTDIINSTSTSLRMSIATKKGTDSRPSSQEISEMPTIESINSINPPSFLMENTTMEYESASITINQDEPTSTTMNIEEPTLNQDEPSTSMSQEKLTDSSGDDTNFSFELNDFANESTGSIQGTPQPVPALMPNVRAPTCTDVAFRALLKPRKGGRISQPVKADSPLAQPNKGRSSAPTSRMLRSSCRRISTETSSQTPAESNADQTTNPTECFVNETTTDGKTEFVEMVTVNEEDEADEEKTASLSLNLSSPQIVEQIETNTIEENITPPKPMMPTLSREYTFNTPKRRSSARRRSMLNSTYGTPMQQNANQGTIEEEAEQEGNNSMLNILLTKPTEVQANVRKSARNSPSIASRSMLNVLLTQPTECETNVTTPSRTSKRKTMDSPSIPSTSMLNVLLTQPTENQTDVATPTRVSKRKTTNSPAIVSKSMLEVLLTKPTETKPNTSIASKSMLGVLLTEPTAENQTEEVVPTEQLESSPSVPSKSMLGILLTQPTENNVQLSPVEASPSIPSRSMLNVLLTNPTEHVETPILEETLPVQSSVTRQSRRSTSQTTPHASINPLHSSTPSAPRSRSLQIVSIGEEEQVSTIVPQQQEIDIIHLDQTNDNIQQATTTTISRTIEMGVQTTPSIDISTRRRFKTLEPQTTPIVPMNQTLSSSMVVENAEKPITPIQTKVIVNLQRRVCFQLTPTTDARLAEKEKVEETLRGMKPDIVIPPTPIEIEPQPEKIKKVPVKKAAKPKKKVVASKTKKAQPKTKETPVATKRATRKAAPAPAKVAEPSAKRVSRKETPSKTTATSTKRAQSKDKSPAKPTKRAPSKEKPAVVQKKQTQSKEEPPVAPKKRTQSKEKPPVPPTKRTSRKRTIEEVKPTSIEKQPTVKRVRNSKSADLPPPVPKARAVKEEKPIAQSAERPTRTRSRSTNNQKRNSQVKNTTPTVRTSKRRLESVEKTESTKKKVEEEKPLPIAVQSVELNVEERQKIESLTVAGLKSRLNTHKANIPKNAKKADLIALLIQFETNAQQNSKPTETIPVNTTTMTTRRRKK